MKFEYIRSQPADILAARAAGKIYVADFSSGEGKYVSAAFGSETEPYDAMLRISSRVEVRITYLTKNNTIDGVQITKLSGKTIEKIHLSTLDFNGVLSLLHIFTELDLKSVTNKSIILDSSIIDDAEGLKKHLNTILADEKGMATLVKLAESKSVLENLSAAYKQQTHQEQLEKLEKLLKLKEDGNVVEEIKKHEDLQEYLAGQPEKIFQKWIEKNLWVFGVEYAKKHDASKIGLMNNFGQIEACGLSLS